MCTIHGMNTQRLNMPQPEKPLAPEDYPVLAVLELGPAHGYDVWRHLRENLRGIWNVGRSKIYAQLAQLERNGLLSHERVEQESLPARKVFSLTERGRNEVHYWMKEPVGHVRDLRLQFPAKLYFARKHADEFAAELVRRQTEVCRNKRERVQEQIRVCDNDIEREVLRYRIGVIDATIQWLSSLLETG